MSNINLNIQIDKKSERTIWRIFNELGLNMATAINIFLKSTIREHGIPFELKIDIPNTTTIAAIEEGRKIIADPNVPKYSNLKGLMNALDKWNIL